MSRAAKDRRATLQGTPICLRRQKLSATTNLHGLRLGASCGTLSRLMEHGGEGKLRLGIGGFV